MRHHRHACSYLNGTLARLVDLAAGFRAIDGVEETYDTSWTNRLRLRKKPEQRVQPKENWTMV